MTAAAPITQQIRSARFRDEREAGWQRLEALLEKVRKKGIRSLEFEEAQELAALYRQAMTSLSLAREISLDRGLLTYLEALCARAYLAVYAPQEQLSGLVSRLLVHGIPGAARRSVGLILLAFGIMGLGALAGFLLFLDDPLWYNTFVPDALAGDRGINSSRADLEAVIYGSDEESAGGLAAFASFLFSHNTRIAIFIFSLGVLACLPSAALTFYNGLLLGSFVALHADRGLTYDIAAWLSVHGVTELSAIIIACAGGLKLGLAVLFPGDLTRRDALRVAGRDAVKLAILAALMLIAAALLEGFARQMVQDPAQRLVIGWGVGALWLAWLGLSGRGHPEPGPPR